MKMHNTIRQQSLKNEYDAVNICVNPVQYTRATRSAFAYDRPAFAYVIIVIIKRYVVNHNCAPQ